MGYVNVQSVRSPFGQVDILRYVALLYNSGFSYSSVVSRLSAISYWIRFKGWPLVTQDFVVLQALRGVRSLSSGVHRNKFPVTPDVLRVLCRSLLSMNLHSNDIVRLRAMFLLSFYALLRVSELCGSPHAILFQNIRVQPAYITISFTSYKFSRGKTPNVFIPATRSELCPVAALISYIASRGTAPGPLFLNADGSPCTTARFRAELFKVVSHAGLSDYSITPHSFRVGAATVAAAMGLPEDTIQRMGRWTSRAFTRYIKFQINRF